MISRKWLIIVITVMGGILIGLGLFTFQYAEGGSYFSNDPEACLNCHIMRDQYETWTHSSHKTIAVCNDCHTPHTLARKYLVKGINGWNHSVAFTLKTYPDNLHIRDFNAEVVQENCVECHETLVSQIHLAPEHDEELACVTCHEGVGHRRK